VDVIRKDLGQETMREFGLLFKESIEHSLKHRQPALDYAIQYGRGLNPELNDKFVGMYVNDRTVEIGADGEAGFRRLLEEGYKKGIIPKPVAIEFVPQ
jgi:1,4-dihydroxy-6-naphthoate synthase